MSAAVRPAAIFRRALRPEEVSGELRLLAAEWGILFAASGEHTVAQIGGALGLGAEERDRGFARLVGLGLLVERPLTLGEYVRAAATDATAESRSLAEFLRVAPARPSSPGIEEGAGAASPGPASPAARSAPPPFRPLPMRGKETAMSPREKESPRRLRLRALLDFVVGRAPSAEQGQLDVYRLFLKVDPKLLRRNGITTLRFEDDRQVSDPELVGAIERAVESVLGAACPAGVFAE